MIAKSLFGKMPDGRKVYAYTFTDAEGQSVVVSEYGCALLEINVFGKDGGLHDVALGYDTLAEYISSFMPVMSPVTSATAFLLSEIS